jgi:tripartite ATP-independent transporter DctM subunit
MTSVATPVAHAAGLPGPAPGLARVLRRTAEVLDVYCRGAVGIATFGTVVGALLAMGSLAANVFARYVLDFSIFGAEEVARIGFLWTIWMGVSLAVRRGAVTVITFVADRGAPAWRRSVRTFSGLALAILLVYACWRSTEYAMAPATFTQTFVAAKISFFYPVASMTIGYYFITLHTVQALTAGAAELAASGRGGLRQAVSVILGGAALTAAVLLFARQTAGDLGSARNVVGIALVGAAWLVAVAVAPRSGILGATVIAVVLFLAAFGLLEAGASELVAIGLIFVALTLAGTPIVFMLSIVGIIASLPHFFGLTFYPTPDPIYPFSTTQFTMGLSGGGELLVILMFLIVAEVMNASGMSDRLIRFAASIVGHLRGGMAYVCQLTSVMVSGVSGSAQADAAIMTPLLVPAMEKEGYPRPVAAAVVSAASIKGPIGPISLMFIVYGFVVDGINLSRLLVSGILAILVLFVFQAATVYVEVRVRGFHKQRPFSSWSTVARSGLDALPILAIPVLILGGIFVSGVFTPSESAPVAAVLALTLALFWYSGLSPRDIPRVIATAGLETGIVLLLLGDSQILAKLLANNQFGQAVTDFFTGITDNRYVFLLVVNGILLAIGIFIEPLPAVFMLAPFLHEVAVHTYGIDPEHFGLIMCFNLVLALIHPPIGLVLFLVSSLAKVSVEKLSITILPWLGVSIVVLFLITYLPSQVVLVLADAIESPPSWLGSAVAVLAAATVASWAALGVSLWRRRDLTRDQRANWILFAIVLGVAAVLVYFVHMLVGRARGVAARATG